MNNPQEQRNTPFKQHATPFEDGFKGATSNSIFQMPIGDNLSLFDRERLKDDVTNFHSPEGKLSKKLLSGDKNFESIFSYSNEFKSKMGSKITKLDNSARLNSTANEVLKKSKSSLENELVRLREENNKVSTEVQIWEERWRLTEAEIKKLEARARDWIQERNKKDRIVKEYQEIVDQLKISSSNKDSEIEALTMKLEDVKKLADYNQAQFDKEVIAKASELGVSITSTSYRTNAEFFKFLLSELHTKMAENNELISKETQDKLKLLRELEDENKSLKSALEARGTDLQNERKANSELKEKLATSEARIEWCETVNVENENYRKVVDALREDLQKKESVISDLEQSTDFFNTGTRSFEEKKRAFFEGKPLLVADIRELLEKFRNDYEFILESYRSLSKKYEAASKLQPQEKTLLQEEGAIDAELLMVDERIEQINNMVGADSTGRLFGWEIYKDPETSNLKCIYSKNTELWIRFSPDFIEIEISDNLKSILSDFPSVVQKIHNLPEFFSNLCFLLNEYSA